jgi:hypothetical protein
MPQSKPDAHCGVAAYGAAMDAPPQEPPDPASSHSTCFVAVVALLAWLAVLLVARSV